MIRRGFKLEELLNSVPNNKWAQKISWRFLSLSLLTTLQDIHRNRLWQYVIFINSVISDSNHQLFRPVNQLCSWVWFLLLFGIFLFRRHNSLNSYCICYGASTSFIQNAFRYLLPGIHTYSIFLPRLTTKSFVSEQACKHLFTSEYYHLSTIFLYCRNLLWNRHSNCKMLLESI